MPAPSIAKANASLSDRPRRPELEAVLGAGELPGGVEDQVSEELGFVLVVQIVDDRVRRIQEYLQRRHPLLAVDHR
jgi:hypothetical protein